MDKQAQLLSRLQAWPELTEKLIEALQTKRFFVTLSYQKTLPGQRGDLQHYWIRAGYQINDVLPSLRHIAHDWAAKENPTAEVGGSQGWF